MRADQFFGLHVDPFSLGGQVLALAIAAVLGGVVGAERELRGHAAGMRTHILVCVGSALITVASIHLSRGPAGSGTGDPGHVAAQIVSGIGFLGAGLIIREGMTVVGLTTAASVWATAGIGIAVGASPRMSELAIVATLIILCVLSLLTRVEDAINTRQRIITLNVETRGDEQAQSRLIGALARSGIAVLAFQADDSAPVPGQATAGTAGRMRLRVRLPAGLDQARLNGLLTEDKDVVSFELG